MKQVLVIVPMDEKYKRMLEESAPECRFVYSSYEAVTVEDAEVADIIFGNIQPEFLAGCGHLQLLQLNSAGVEPYIKAGVLPEGTALTCASGAYGIALAEHMMGQLLAMKKKLFLYYENQKERKWKDEGPVTGVYQTRTLIVGLGDIGTEFARRMHAMGSHVVGIKRTTGKAPEFVDELYTLEALDDQLALADTVALTLPGTPATYHLMSRERLLRMKKDAFLLNIGRGTAMSSDDLYEVMKTGHLAGAALDVTDLEPLPEDHPLWGLNNVWITPHISGEFHMEETLRRIVKIGAKNIAAILSGRPLANVVDFEKGYKK